MIVLTRTVTRDECPWLDADIAEGTEVFRYYGYTYGCVTPNGVAVSFRQDQLPFFEIPRSAIGYIDVKDAA